jgi:pantetheine-phosphate adenylyltransferase
MPTNGLAVYAFSGDPITYGHLDIIKRSLKLFPKLIVAIGTNPDKTYTFSAKERESLAKQALVNFKEITVKSFQGLLVDFAYEQGAKVIIKGVRDPQDFQYEQTLNSVGQSQNLGLETVILFAKPELVHVSSSAVKALQQSQGLVHDYVPLPVKVALEKKLSNQVLIGITGEIASGKTHVAEQLVIWGRAAGKKIHNMELDHLAHQIQTELKEPEYLAVRENIVKNFGKGVRNSDGTINRKKLGEKVFTDPQQLELLNQIMWQPVLVRLRHELISKQGVIFINSALLAEANLMAVCNNRVVMVNTTKAMQKKRLQQRGFSANQINRRLKSQFSAAKKIKLIEQSIDQHSFGQLWSVNDRTNLIQFAKNLFKEIY